VNGLPIQVYQTTKLIASQNAWFMNKSTIWSSLNRKTGDIKYRSRNRDRLTECEKQLAQLAGTKTSPPTRGPAFIAARLQIGLISQSVPKA
jgi:hypothetical protein